MTDESHFRFGFCRARKNQPHIGEQKTSELFVFLKVPEAKDKNVEILDSF